MIVWHSSPGRVAVLLVDRFLDGEVSTPGQYATWIETLASLPPRLREWVISQIEPVIGPDGTAKIRAHLPIGVLIERAGAQLGGKQ